MNLLKEIKDFQNNFFFWELSNGQLECSFENLQKKSWPESRKMFSECPSKL